MAVSGRLKKLFEEEKVAYELMVHWETCAAREKAAGVHVPGAQLAMLVLSAEHNIDFARVKKVLGAKDISLACEEDFADLFPDCDLAAMPPFGNFSL